MSDTPTIQIMISVIALGVALVSLAFSFFFGWSSRKHNRNSVKPLPFVAVSDYEDELVITFENSGTGPCVLREVKFFLDNKQVKETCFADILTFDSGMLFDDFRFLIPGRAVRSGDSIQMMKISQETIKDTILDWEAVRDSARSQLSQIELQVTYTDIYSTKYPPIRQSLTWFGRHGNSKA